MAGTSAKIAVVLHILKGQPWGEGVRRDILRELGGAPSVRVEFADSAGSATRQLSLLDHYLKQRIDGLIVAPIDPAAARAALRPYRDAGVPVIVIDNDVGDPELYRAMILADNRHIGRTMGEFFVDAMDGQGDIVEIQGIAVTTAAADRSAGFRSAIASYPGLRLLDSCVGDWLYDRAREEFTRLLARHHRIDGVYAQNDEMARAAHDAAAQVGRADEMLISGVDALSGEHGTIRLVSQGVLAATCLNPSPGREAVRALLAVLAGEPVLQKQLLKSSILRSSERVHAWREARGR